MRKIHREVIATLNAMRPRSFDSGSYSVRRETIYMEGRPVEAWVAYHYATAIILTLGETVILNASPYSRTTSAFQSAARESFPRRHEVPDLYRGVSGQSLYNATAL